MQVWGNEGAFAALKSDGSVLAWGDPGQGGGGANGDERLPAGLKNVISIATTQYAFCALMADGSILGWGDQDHGGSYLPKGVSGVRRIFTTQYSFCVLTFDEKIFAWGSESSGGKLPGGTMKGVKTVGSSWASFCALKDPRGSVICWGDPYYGGSAPQGLENVIELYAGGTFFVALHADGSTRSWGTGHGSTMAANNNPIKFVVTSSTNFAAFRADGSIEFGYQSYWMYNKPSAGQYFTQIYANRYNFVGVSQDGRLTGFGRQYDAGQVPSNLPSPARVVFGTTWYYADSWAVEQFPCPPGSYGTGYPHCTKCPTLSGQQTPNKLSLGIHSHVGICIICPSGKFSVDGMTCTQTCPVPGMTYVPPTYFSEIKGCRKCVRDGYQFDPITQKCTICGYGKYGTADGVCSDCPMGKYSDKLGVLACSTCDRGMLTSGPGSYSCFANCPAGEFGVLRVCLQCPKDSYAPSSGHGECQHCPPGYGTNSTKGNSACMNKDLYERCPPGFERNLNSRLCDQCQAGTFSAGNKAKCDECPPGKYISGAGSTTCMDCVSGKYSNKEGAQSEDACVECPATTYGDRTGSSSCTMCPPGSACPSSSMTCPDQCPPGSYASKKGATACEGCSAGRYQTGGGEAFCLSCPAGKFSKMNGSASLKDCLDCGVGTYSSAEGAQNCVSCPRSQYNDATGQTACLDCTGTDISNEDGTECEADPNIRAQSAPSLVEELYLKGGALYGSGAIMAGFMVLILVIQFQKEMVNKAKMSRNSLAEGKLATLSPFKVLFKSGIAGYGFGSEFFLILGLLVDSPPYGFAMMAFRCLHPICAGIHGAMLFYPNSRFVKYLDSKNIFSDARDLHKSFDDKFSGMYFPHLVAIMTLSFFDCSVLQFLPWNDSQLYNESHGFPSMSVLKFVLGVNTLQSTATVICQVTYLFTNNNIGPTTSTQAKALFMSNIAFSITGSVVGLLYFCMKGKLLARIHRANELKKKSVLQRRSLEAMEELDMGTFYGNVGADIDAQDEPSMHDNPLHVTGGGMTQQRDQNIQQLRDQNLALQEQNEQLEQELRRSNTEDSGADETSLSRDEEVAQREGEGAELSL